jgi:hypothetical protein
MQNRGIEYCAITAKVVCADASPECRHDQGGCQQHSSEFVMLITAEPSVTPTRKTKPNEAGGFDLRGSVYAGLTGRFVVSVVQVRGVKQHGLTLDGLFVAIFAVFSSAAARTSRDIEDEFKHIVEQIKSQSEPMVGTPGARL